MLSIIESSISLPIVLCNCIYQYAKPRVERYMDEYGDVIYVHCGHRYNIDEEILQCSGINNTNKNGDISYQYLMNRLGLNRYSGISYMAIMSTNTKDLLIFIYDNLLVYEILPNCRYKLLSNIDPYLLIEEVPYCDYLENYNRYGVIYTEPDPPTSNNTHIYKYQPNNMFVYEDKLILCFYNKVHIYNFDTSYNLVLLSKFNTIGDVCTGYKYIVSKDDANLYIYNLDGVLQRSIKKGINNRYDYYIDDNMMLRYDNYMIDLNTDVPLIQYANKPVAIEIICGEPHSDADNSVNGEPHSDLDNSVYGEPHSDLDNHAHSDLDTDADNSADSDADSNLDV